MAGVKRSRSTHAARRKFYPAAPPREPAAAPPDAESPWVRLRSVHKHPFIYQRMVDGADPAAQPGDVVAVYDKAGQIYGRGLYNPRSQITVRMLSRGPAPIDQAFWRRMLEQAVALRRRLNLEAQTDAYRLVHAEGDGLSGLIVERYADVLVFEPFSLGMHRLCGDFARLLSEILGPPAPPDRRAAGRAAGWRTHVRVDPRVRSIEGIPETPDGPARARRHVDNLPHKPVKNLPQKPVSVREHGIRYRVDVVGGHKTGFFCDQRENRLALAELCGGADVLDVCCYTGGFALCARLLGKAREVTAVDLDEVAIAAARDNANLNQARIGFIHADAFAYMRQMLSNGRQYDVLVLDPPKLVASRDELDDGLRKYHDLNRLAAQLVRPGGVLLTCSCSGLVSPEAFAETLHRAAAGAGRRAQVFRRTGAGPDHPVLLECPESAYLKALWCRVL